MNLSIIGLGKLGLPIALCVAAKGFKVIGIDKDKKRVALIQENKLVLYEKEFLDFLKRAQGNFTVSTDIKAAIKASDMTFIIVPTPSKSDGSFALDIVLEVCRKIGEVLRDKTSFHLVVINSTVMPGHTDVIKDTLEKLSGKTCGRDFGLCYNPEFVALGNVIPGFLNPDFVLIGESDPKSGEILGSFYKQVCKNDPPVLCTNFINAEIAKLSLNAYITTKISFANMLAHICEKLPGADVDVVTNILGHDHRINPFYFKAGLGYAGPCFPRDNKALMHFTDKIGVRASISAATEEMNSLHLKEIIKKIKAVLSPQGKVCILGLSYKPDTDVIEGSQSIEIIKQLLKDGVSVIAYDPQAMDNAKQVLPEVNFASSVEEGIDKAEVIVLAVPWVKFNQINGNVLKGKTVIDCWRLWKERLSKDKNVSYVSLGRGEEGSIC
ncbi:MAG: nucleotide sugar dehydrogenase [Candidatus Desulfofervidaceae bacterium]|nr:nucleotide sugar dehydrogenase [Candidatus Desulfofervidaceae bacterium]